MLEYALQVTPKGKLKQKLFAEFGVEVTVEELRDLMVPVGADGELDEDALDAVAGGGFIKWFIEKLFGWTTKSAQDELKAYGYY